MNPYITEKLEHWRKKVRTFAEEVILPEARILDKEERFSSGAKIRKLP